jgi:flagellar motor switch protein FliG
LAIFAAFALRRLSQTTPALPGDASASAPLAPPPTARTENSAERKERTEPIGIPSERDEMDSADDRQRPSFDAAQPVAIPERMGPPTASVPFGFLQKAGVPKFLPLIADEHPQTIALILSHLPQAMATEALSGLPSKKRSEVALRLNHMEQSSPEVIRDVEAGLRGRMKSNSGQGFEEGGRVPLTARGRNVAGRVANQGLHDNLKQRGSVPEKTRRRAFAFGDLPELDNSSLETVLKDVDNSQWAVALKGGSEEIKQKILGNLAPRAAGLLRREMESLGPVCVSDVEAMQQQIVDIIRRLEYAGEIAAVSGAASEQYIS